MLNNKKPIGYPMVFFVWFYKKDPRYYLESFFGVSN